MGQGLGDLLGAVVAAAQRSAVERERQVGRPALERAAETRAPRAAAFAESLGRDGVRVIAECKRRSPSRGVLRAAYDPVAIATGYASAGAAAISVLTEPTFFDGSLDHLRAVRNAVDVPLLCKDFLVSESQLLEARAAGADAVLLIVAALDPDGLSDLLSLARTLGLATLVEVHDREELQRALDAGARIVGVNSRNLRTLDVSVAVFDELAPHLPRGVIAVAESGLRSATDLARLRALRYDAFLIGERFMTEPDPGGALLAVREAAERGGDRMRSTRIKICGITRPEDAALAVELGADALGFVFWPRSPRVIDGDTARAIAASLPALVARVGVFVDAPVESVQRIVTHVGLNVVQLHGTERVDDYRALPVRLIKSVTLDSDADVDRAAALPAHVTLLVDATDPVKRGGTGRAADWSLAATLARRRPIMLAGGLAPENASEAVRIVQPWAVDVSSGVESAPGIKSSEKLTRLFAALRTQEEGSEVAGA